MDLGKHSVYTHLLEDKIYDIWQRTNIIRTPCRKRNDGVVSCAEIFGDLIQTDHKVSTKEVNQDTIIDAQSWKKDEDT